jgi:hypothetical protein
LLAEHVPTLLAGPFVHSLVVQQEVPLLGMQAPVAAQVLNAGATQEQTPAPVQVRLPPQSLLVQQEATGMHVLPHILNPLAHGKLHVFAVPHTPVVFAGPPVQSALVQHPAVAMHRLVLAHRLKPVLHAMPQVPAAPPVQVADPFAAGDGQDPQLVPQNVVLVSGWQIPLQLCCPVMHTPLHAFAVAMHAPRHSFIPVGHAGWHARPSQVTVPPPVGAWQGMQDASSLGPHVATALLSTHLPPHTWNPVLHISAHIPLMQAAVPLVSVGHVTHVAPHPVASLSEAHRAPVPAPQRCVPAAHVKSHVVPSHVVALAPVGLGQPVQVVPHVSTLLFVAQMPLQSCVPVGQVPQAAVVAMQAPAHSLVSVGQAGTHAVPSQATEPPVGIVHAVHEVVPQLPVSSLLTHLAPQM